MVVPVLHTLVPALHTVVPVSVPDTWHIGADPDPRIRTFD
jgi:hypothetical protein